MGNVDFIQYPKQKSDFKGLLPPHTKTGKHDTKFTHIIINPNNDSSIGKEKVGYLYRILPSIPSHIPNPVYNKSINHSSHYSVDTLKPSASKMHPI